MITIVDCGINNLRSVQKAFEHLGFDTHVTRDPADVLAAEKLVLPGVGAFGAAMKSLRDAGLVEPLLESIAAGKPFLGICLALQLLFESSEELGRHAGLAVLPGAAVRLPDAPDLKIPHMGWSALHLPRATRLFKDVPEGSMVYFVHSYHVVPADPSVTAATSCHGIEFVAAVEHENVMAMQFHPEKSSGVGLKLLDNFARL